MKKIPVSILYLSIIIFPEQRLGIWITQKPMDVFKDFDLYFKSQQCCTNMTTTIITIPSLYVITQASHTLSIRCPDNITTLMHRLTACYGGSRFSPDFSLLQVHRTKQITINIAAAKCCMATRKSVAHIHWEITRDA